MTIPNETVRAAREAIHPTQRGAAELLGVGLRTLERWEAEGADERVRWLLVGRLYALRGPGAPELVPGLLE